MSRRNLHDVTVVVPELAATDRTGGMVTGSFEGFDADGRFLVRYPGVTSAVPAASTVGLSDGDIGAGVVLGFERGGSRPIVLGRVLERRPSQTKTVASLDGERVVLRGRREIELRCGDASIVLTRAGKILIRGAYVLSRSKGANKIKGAFVDIN